MLTITINYFAMKIERSFVIFGLKLIVGVTLFTVMLMFVGHEHLLNDMSQIEPVAFVSALILANALIAMQAIRQYCLLPNGVTTARSMVKVQYIATFMGNFLPATIGVDAYKVYFLNRFVNSLFNSSKLVLVDRLGGMLTITIIGVISLSYDPTLLQQLLSKISIRLESNMLAIFLIVALMVALTTLLILSLKRSKSPWLKNLNLFAFALNSIIVYCLQIGKFMLLGKMIGLNISFIVLAQLLLVQQFAAIIPITVGGLGVVEISIVGILAMAGIPAPQATSIALGNRLTIIIMSAIGYLFWHQLKLPKDQSLCS